MKMGWSVFHFSKKRIFFSVFFSKNTICTFIESVELQKYS